MTIKTGVLLAGGSGTRLNPLTGIGGSNKHLIPVHNRFIIDYSLSSLVDMGCENISVILGGAHFEQIVRYLGDGSKFNCKINYLFQGEPKGIAQAISLTKPFIQGDFVVMLGDNVFDSKIEFKEESGAHICLANHSQLQRFGVASCLDGKIIKLEEKPKQIDSQYLNYAVSGCYKLDQKFFEYFDKIQPSSRGEYEIVDVLSLYLKDDNLKYSNYKGLWSDAGTFDSINKLNNYFFAKDSI
jgi:glucose-1-phosphate thymidylyltransferase